METPLQDSAQPQQTATPIPTQNIGQTTPQSTPSSPAAATPTNQPKETGHVPGVSPAAPAGQGEPTASLRSAASEMARKRWANPKPPSEPPKAQPIALLNSPNQAQANDLENQPTSKGGGIDGLSRIPDSWPELPGNVSQGQEIAWVQAERLRVVKEQSSGRVKVDLSKARFPAPSMSAIGWLETSIRSYAKFIEVASKQASSGQDEAEFVRKERMQIAEIDALLAEMYDEEG